jgi:hypothetical protein
MSDDRDFAIACEICGSTGPAECQWFLLSASRWQDRLKIMSWNEEMAQQDGVHLACGVHHVRELVSHWLITGSLDFPFARLVATEAASVARVSEGLSCSAPSQIGELAVHRESLEHILAENPYAMTSILEALIAALSRPARSDEAATEEIMACVGAQA